VRLGPSTPGDYVRARVLVPRNPGVTSGLRLSRERKRTCHSLDTCQYRTLACPCHRPGYPLSRDLAIGGLDLTQRGPVPTQGVRLVYLGVPDRTRRSGLSVQGSSALSWRSGPTDGIMEYITSSGHVASLGPPTWWSRALFTTRPEIAAQAPCLHTVVRDTP
jgi:hypothetical protein